MTKEQIDIIIKCQEQLLESMSDKQQANYEELCAVELSDEPDNIECLLVLLEAIE